MRIVLLFILVVGFLSCNNLRTDKAEDNLDEQQISYPQDQPYLVVLGTVQDAGSPHAACEKACCSALFDHPDPSRLVTCLGLVDPIAQKTILLEASPDLPRQMEVLLQTIDNQKKVVDAIFLTHAHIGHYTGLMYLGRESMNASKVPVYAMPKMASFLSNNGPWDQLVEIDNITIHPLEGDTVIHITDNVSITPISVPHRDEYSETVGFLITTKRKKVLFIPDIDKWEKWDQSIAAWISNVDIAFLDATFYDGNEVKRDISEIPHPFVVESMEAFKTLSDDDKAKVHFIHLNHTNPLLVGTSDAYQEVIRRGYQIATFRQVIGL